MDLALDNLRSWHAINQQNKQIYLIPIDETLTSTTTSGQSRPGFNVNEKILHSPQISTIEASWPD